MCTKSLPYNIFVCNTKLLIYNKNMVIRNSLNLLTQITTLEEYIKIIEEKLEQSELNINEQILLDLIKVKTHM
jgi:hypothetical protein